MKLKKNQSGFGLVEVLLIIIVLILIGAITWFFISQRNKNNQSADTSSSSQSQSTEQAATVDTSYFDIPELGVKLLLPQKIDGLYYAALSNNTKAGLSTYALADLSAGCDASKSALAYVGYYTDPNAPDPYSGDSTMEQAFPNATNIGGKYYYIATSNGPCTSNPAADFSPLDVLKQATVVKL